MIQLQKLRFSIGQRVLFEDLDWVIAPGDRVALVGPNGAGKTTLLRVILGEYTPDVGARVMARGTRLGYLPQEAAERFDGTVLDRAMEAHRSLLAMSEELEELHRRLGGISPDDPHLEALLERAGEVQSHLELNDMHALEPEARRVLGGLGFSVADQDRPLAEFSGGWRMRAALAALLLADPTLLFLDEPTNHLDLPAMEWLEDYLEDFHGGLVVISHDRVFLDRVATEVRELDHGVLSDYPMKFTAYLEERERRREQIEASNVQLGAKIAQLEKFVERFGAKNTKAAQAASKKKQIARLKSEHVILPRKARSIRFSFPNPPHAGRTLFRLRDAAFAYGDRDVFTRANVEISPGDKVAIVGANGAGKTTLLRVIAGQLQEKAGERDVPQHTRMSYFAQHAAETLDPTATVLGALEDIANAEWRPRLRGMLGSFLFSGDDVYKLCRILSGGERQRVALARILLEPANLLLLDEPTHHLDLGGKEVLETALEQYPGAVVVVTHDRSLMARLATRILEVNDGKVIPYPGGYDDYESARLSRTESERERSGSVALPVVKPSPSGGTVVVAPVKAPTATRGGKTPAAPAGGKAAADAAHHPGGESREQRAARQKRQKEQSRVERDIETRETRMKAIEAELVDPDVYANVARS
ncbi:MAG: ABC-F family ATP-binding cassette domain-containing protein, partial [Candidatus Eisenbacteria bacterium]